MTWDITDRFPNWGESGESPPTGFFYEGGDQVNEKHLDYLWNSVKGLEDDVQTALNDIDSDGDGKVDTADTAENGVPSGGIVMWSGSTTNVPSGWTLCDGTDGAPDLRNRFVAGAGDEYSVGDTGGEKEHTLTKNEIPSHEHEHTDRYNSTSGTGLAGEGGNNMTSETRTTDSVGGDRPHENRPRFYSLAYIYKL